MHVDMSASHFNKVETRNNQNLEDSSKTFVHNSILLTGLEFTCTVRDFLCLLIDFNGIRNCIQKFLLIHL